MRKSDRRWLLAMTCCVWPWAAQPASAQAAQTPSAGTATPTSAADAGPEQEARTEAQTGDIIVTAQKREERLQDVPMSITAATGEQLKSLGVTNMEDLERVVPGLTINKTYYGLPVFFLRGVGFNDASLGTSPAVSVYADQLPIPFSAMARGATLDLERLEVLKGPQGTLFGQNSTGGLVNYIAAKPTDRLRAGFDLTVGRFHEVDAEAFISGPLSDTLSARLAVRNEYRGVWQRGYTIPQTLGRRDFRNGRLLIDWKPTNFIKVELLATGWQDKSDAQQAQFAAFEPLVPAPFGYPPGLALANFPVAPKDARAVAFDPNGDFVQNNRYYQFGGRIDVALSDRVNATSLTSYSRYKQKLPSEFDATTLRLGYDLDNGDIHSFSQELRFDGSMANERLKWMIGANYQKDRVFEQLIQDPLTTSAVAAPPFGGFRITGFRVENLQRIETKAVFGSLDIGLTDTLTIQGSARYTDQDRSFRGCARDLGDGQTAGAFASLSSLVTGRPTTIAPGACVTLGPNGESPAPIVTDTLNQDNVSWRGSVNWKPGADALVYVNVTKGYKAGSFSTFPYANSTLTKGISQESVLAYEAGAKVDALQRRVQLSGAIFYYDYHDKQLYGYVNIPALGGAFPGLVTIPKASVKGAEAAILVRPVEGLTLTANATYVDTKIKADPAVPIGPFNNPTSFVGQPFGNTPKWQGFADAEYRFGVSSDWHAYVGGSVTARSSTHGSLVSGAPAVAAKEAILKIPSYTLLDLRAGVESPDGVVRVEAFGHNVTNKFYIIGSTRGADTVARYTGLPVTYGVNLFYRFR